MPFIFSYFLESFWFRLKSAEDGLDFNITTSFSTEIEDSFLTDLRAETLNLYDLRQENRWDQDKEQSQKTISKDANTDHQQTSDLLRDKFPMVQIL